MPYPPEEDPQKSQPEAPIHHQAHSTVIAGYGNKEAQPLRNQSAAP